VNRNLTFHEVDLLLVDPDTLARNTLRTTLHNAGFRILRHGQRLQDMMEHIAQAMPDLLICEAALPDGDFYSFVRDLRHHEVGSNPFLPIIALTGNPTPDLVRAIIDSGADHLIVKPISLRQLQDRILALIKARKPFVVTSDYIGPDRRGDEERNGARTPSMEVPNTLRAKVTGDPDISECQAAIDRMIVEINLRKLERYADQIVWLVDRVAPDLEAGAISESTRDDLNRLLYCAEDTGRRLGGTKYDHVSDLCLSLIKVSSEVRRRLPDPPRREVRLLRPLASAILAGFETGTAKTAREIYASIGG
jgi:DNA-binding response OmpR family regulator